jgi:hypothetical protein
MNYLTTKKLLTVLALIGLTLGGCGQSGDTGRNPSPTTTTSTSNSTPSATPSTDTSASATPSTDTGTSTSSSSGTPHISDNTEIQVNLPSNWSKTTGLNDKAELEVSNPGKQMYLIILTESKEDFKKAGQNINLQEHSKLTREILGKSITDAQENGPKSLTINGNNALQYEIFGVNSNLKIAYLHTTVETANNYHQIIAYTSQDAFSNNRAEMEAVINSFQEVKK